MRDLRRLMELMENPELDVNLPERPSVGSTLNNGKVKIVAHEYNGDPSKLTIHLREGDEDSDEHGTAEKLEPEQDGYQYRDWTRFVRTALQTAADYGYLDIVEYLLQERVPPKQIDVNEAPYWEYGRTALQAAIESGHKDIVQVLLAHGADVFEQPDADIPIHRTTMQLALNLESPLSEEILRMLIFDGGKERSGFYQYMCRLLDSGRWREIVLFKGVLETLPETLEVEILNRRKSQLTDSIMQAAAWACKSKRWEHDSPGLGTLLLDMLVRPSLVKRAANSLTSFDKKTPLHLAAELNNCQAVEKLLEEGAQVGLRLNWRDKGKSTAVSLAAERGNAWIARVLLRHGASTDRIRYEDVPALLQRRWGEEEQGTTIVRVRGPGPFIAGSKGAKDAAEFSHCTEVDSFSSSARCHFGPEYGLTNSLDWLKPSILFRQ